jgi:nucleotide-binding universal stress UspA family protein
VARGGGLVLAQWRDRQTGADRLVAREGAASSDLIVMASHGRRGLSKFILGSQATRVLALPTIPALVCPTL